VGNDEGRGLGSLSNELARFWHRQTKWLCLLGKTQQRCPIFALHEAMGAHTAMPGIAQALRPGGFVFLCQAPRCTQESGEWVLGASRGNWELLLEEKAEAAWGTHAGREEPVWSH